MSLVLNTSSGACFYMCMRRNTFIYVKVKWKMILRNVPELVLPKNVHGWGQNRILCQSKEKTMVTPCVLVCL